MTWPRLRVRHLVGAALLMPSLLMIQPVEAVPAPQTPAVAKGDATKEQPSRKVKPGPKASKKPPDKKAAEPKPSAKKTEPRPTEKKSAEAKFDARLAEAKPGDKRANAGKTGDDRCIYVARKGDSIGRIASQHRVSKQAILATNRLTSADGVKAGQRLEIPGCRKDRPETAAVPPALELEDGLLLARVGPHRIPTRLFVAVPEFNGSAIEFAWPVEGPVASGFGRRRSGWHAGIDIKAEGGTPVLAAATGTVIFSGWGTSYGRLVKVQHNNGFVTVYAHNSENLVQVGDEVVAGTVIATVGRTGRASAHHLHFEIRREGMAFNPLYLLDSRDSTPVLVHNTAEPLDEEIDEDIRE